MKTVLNKKNIKQIQPMFLGEDLGLQRYENPKYPKFMDLYDKQLGQFWRPQEIDLSKDRNDYKNLTKEEKFIFDSNIRWQTMTDSMLSRSIHNITKYISNPELEICCEAWSFFETIHSNSYTWILQNVTDNPTEFFDSILDDHEIVSRATEISKAYDRLLGEPKDIKQEIFDAVLSTQITEGLAFYISFACSFFFGSRGKMKGNSDIISLIARDENLHVAITQNIMKNWRDHKDEGFQDIFRDNKQKVIDTYGLAAENEKKWSQYLFSNGSVLGLNEESLNDHIEWLANNRLTSLGFPKIFSIKTSPLSGWVDKMLGESSSIQVAPQETEIISYKIGARDTTINESDFEDITL